MLPTSRILRFIEAHRDDLLEFTKRLVATPSVNPPGDERAVAAVIAAEMERLGLGAPEVAAKRAERPNLLYTLKCGSPGRRLLYAAHTDTKPVGPREAWQTDPFVATMKDGRLYGLGTSDMKGGCAALIYSVAAVAAEAHGLAGELLLALTADEEAGSTYGAHYLTHEYGLRADAGLIAEPAGVFKPWEVLPVVSRGNCCFTIRVYGTQMHSSIMDLQPSVNASVKMAGILSRMPEELEVHFPRHPFCPQGVTLNAGAMVRGGVYYSVTPGFAEFSSDLRVVPGMSLEGVRRDVEAFLARLQAEDPELRAELVFERETHWISAQEVSPDEPLVQLVADVAERVLGQRPPLGAVPFATDARCFQGEAGIPMIPAFGPGTISTCHAPNEYVLPEDIVAAAKIYALTALEYLRLPE
jgi:acetylornithine deacetylase/succinyl-diaminopimelate desuccinylase-like protein